MSLTLRQRIICLSLVAITALALVATVVALGLPKQYEIAVGDFSPETIYASRQINDTVTTEERRKAASDMITEQYNLDFTASEKAIKNFGADITALTTARDNQGIEIDNALPLPLPVTNNSSLSQALFNKAIKLSDTNFNILKNHIPTIFETVINEGVTDSTTGIESFTAYLDKQNITNSDVREIAIALCTTSIEVNKIPDPEKTKSMRAAEANGVETVVYQKNQIIVEKGEKITEAQFRMLSELGYVKGKSYIDIVHAVSSAALALLVFALVIAYYVMVGKNNMSTSHVTVTIICTSLIILGALMVFLAGKMSVTVMYILPVSVIPALIALLLNANLASMVNIIIAVLVGIRLNDFSASLAVIIAGTATAYLFAQVRRRAHLLPATLISALIYSFMYTIALMDTSKGVLGFFLMLVYSFLGGFLGGILTIGTIPFMEAIFDVITPMKLGELSNPEHKLLKKLLLKAPGSYHHALTVANMADAAAAAINANALLARVGAYYHDIGKMENPYYFKENQFADENPHDELPPEESAQIIISHVSDGVHLATQYRLPSIVRDIIMQHHGTTTASFFLYKAREKNPNVDPSIFTYDGPTPQSKEATIIMLADACEAAVRAMREKGYEDVSKIVNDIVASRISDGQLASSELTFSDLDKVKASFVTTLEQYFHKRIIYPQNK
ncbi:MAG: HDIG domain-containing protein [Clostridia bacterium]|nr:HDIG domain-containing protein [Clostridia bacterium]